MNIVQEREIGVFPLTLTDEGLADEGLADEHIKDFGSTLNTGHWHGDMQLILKQPSSIFCD